MDRPEFVPYRRATLAEVRGATLEIGFGTGLNLPHYPAAIKTLITVDASAGMSRLARQRVDDSPIAVEQRVLNGERLPFADETFDSVVSTFTLCSIGAVGQALGELRRVLKPDGRFHFLEHGLSDDPSVQTWQHRMTPLQKAFVGGCHLNRDIEALITQAGFTILRLDRSYMGNTPKTSGYLYQGLASR
jgi:ubiquinone/menaquinone biosynthesis C-methylase UbiE